MTSAYEKKKVAVKARQGMREYAKGLPPFTTGEKLEIGDAVYIDYKTSKIYKAKTKD